MRKVKRFEAHLDDFNLITIYLSKQYYQGKSDFFYLKDASGQLQKLTLKTVENTSHDYTKYVLSHHTSIPIGERIEIIEEHSLATPLQIGLVVKKDAFDEMYAYEGNDLGVRVSEHQTIFKLWAPTAWEVKINIKHPQLEGTFSCVRNERGVYSFKIDHNLHLAHYTYLVNRNGRWIETIDPYGSSSNANGEVSVVIDHQTCHVELHEDKLPALKQKTDAIIYEASIRDFTMDPAGNNPYPGTFKGFITPKTTTDQGTLTGYDYLKTLGVTHVQLLPVYDFYTVDEHNVKTFYNWGYDPHQYNVPEGSYSTDANKPCARIVEFKQLVSQLHQDGMRVVMDVVYNHVFDMDESSFEKVVPYYYFRRGDNGAISNGSFCGNDFDSTRAMARKYIVDSVSMWVKHYGVDGFRFDLMGILDVQTMNLVESTLKAIKPDIMVYGEGWNMPTMLDDSLKAAMFNQHMMPDIGHFNDFYRDHVKGKTSENESSVKGYVAGDVNYKEAMKMALVGNTYDFPFVKLFQSPTQSINYVECHDNATSWDKLKECCKEDSKEVRIKKHKMLIGSILLSMGIPFLHSGQEFARTKNGAHNTYRSSDLINQIDWQRKDRYSDIVAYTQDMIKLRKSLAVLRFNDVKLIQKHVSFTDLQNSILLMEFKDVRAYGEYEHIKIFFNPTGTVMYHRLEDYYQLLANEAGLIGNIPVQSLTINPHTIVVVAK
ncbi:MAG: type I pullulanase [Erysipelotrichia bacterium]|jgi:pullulanase|nr:type I pullulanase [Erysipelotrichia bacterium]